MRRPFAWATLEGGRARRGVFLVPSALTVANIFLGYFAIVKCFREDYEWAAAFIVLAGVMDKLDGIVARATGTTTEFGRELDSLADIITFGVAPALLALSWGLHDLGKPGWVVAFVFLMCGALRLARFNVHAGAADHRFFVGLPIPMAAGVIVTIVLAHRALEPDEVRLQDAALEWWFLALVLAVALLMVSRVRYFAFKDLHFRREQRLLVLLVLVGLVPTMFAWPGYVLLALALAYAAHGPLLRLVPSLAARAKLAAGDGQGPPRKDAGPPGEV